MSSLFLGTIMLLIFIGLTCITLMVYFCKDVLDCLLDVFFVVDTVVIAIFLMYAACSFIGITEEPYEPVEYTCISGYSIIYNKNGDQIAIYQDLDDAGEYKALPLSEIEVKTDDPMFLVKYKVRRYCGTKAFHSAMSENGYTLVFE